MYIMYIYKYNCVETCQTAIGRREGEKKTDRRREGKKETERCIKQTVK